MWFESLRGRQLSRSHATRWVTARSVPAERLLSFAQRAENEDPEASERAEPVVRALATSVADTTFARARIAVPSDWQPGIALATEPPVEAAAEPTVAPAAVPVPASTAVAGAAAARIGRGGGGPVGCQEDQDDQEDGASGADDPFDLG